MVQLFLLLSPSWPKCDAQLAVARLVCRPDDWWPLQEYRNIVSLPQWCCSKRGVTAIPFHTSIFIMQRSAYVQDVANASELQRVTCRVSSTMVTYLTQETRCIRSL